MEALQIRARGYARQQVEQMNDWERALHREWVSLISRNATSFPYPNKTQGLIILRLYTETSTYLVVAVENASVLLPPAYLVCIAP